MNHPASLTMFQSESENQISYKTLLSLLGERERASLERQVLAYETKLGPAAAQRWRSLACILMTLAPARPKVVGSNVMQFYIPDGTYRKQVFAFQALANGSFAVYAPNILEQAVEAGLLSRQMISDEPAAYRLPESGDVLAIDSLDGRTPNPDAFFKDMTGWNRKALRITLPAEPSDAQVGAIGQLCTLAAAQWA